MSEENAVTVKRFFKEKEIGVTFHLIRNGHAARKLAVVHNIHAEAPRRASGRVKGVLSTRCPRNPPWSPSVRGQSSGIRPYRRDAERLQDGSVEVPSGGAR